MIRRIVATMLAAATLIGTGGANAAFPDHTVRIVVGFAPGGSDISARIIGQKLNELWKQPVVIDNRPGAAGNIGADIVAKSPPDGYTILLCVNSYTINTSVYRNLSWDLLRDFAPVGRYAASPMVVVVNNKSLAKTFRELVAYGKANPGKLNYGSAGAGTAPHLAAELFAIQAGVEMTHVPYKGSAPSVAALLADEVQLSFGALSAFDAFIKDGRLRSLAVTTATRNAHLPDVPTVNESGLAGFDVDIWYGLLVPAKTPPAIVKQLSDDLAKVMADPDTQAKIRQAGLDPAYLDGPKMGELMKRDVARWRDVANKVKLSLE